MSSKRLRPVTPTYKVATRTWPHTFYVNISPVRDATANRGTSVFFTVRLGVSVLHSGTDALWGGGGGQLSLCSVWLPHSCYPIVSRSTLCHISTHPDLGGHWTGRGWEIWQWGGAVWGLQALIGWFVGGSVVKEEGEWRRRGVLVGGRVYYRTLVHFVHLLWVLSVSRCQIQQKWVH